MGQFNKQLKEAIRTRTGCTIKVAFNKVKIAKPSQPSDDNLFSCDIQMCKGDPRQPIFISSCEKIKDKGKNDLDGAIKVIKQFFLIIPKRFLLIFLLLLVVLSTRLSHKKHKCEPHHKSHKKRRALVRSCGFISSILWCHMIFFCCSLHFSHLLSLVRLFLRAAKWQQSSAAIISLVDATFLFVFLLSN